MLLVNPPLTGPHGPYPAVAYLEGYLHQRGVDARSADASVQLVLTLLSAEGIEAIRDEIKGSNDLPPLAEGAARYFLENFEAIRRWTPIAIRCLQGTDQGAELRIARAHDLPPRLHPSRAWAQVGRFGLAFADRTFGPLAERARGRFAEPGHALLAAFGPLGIVERARHLASGLIEDVAAVIRAVVDPDFSLDAYAETIEAGAATFQPIRRRLERSPTLIDGLIDRIGEELTERYRPTLVGLTVPFAGSLLGALRLARRIKQVSPEVKIVLGGGWVSAHLRDLTDPGLFEYVDFVVLDSGERPLECIVEFLLGRRSGAQLLRTFVCVGGRVTLVQDSTERDAAWNAAGPTYRSLAMPTYLAYRPELHPFSQIVFRRWNKLTLAHGCYWKKCSFCDTAFDYIARYEVQTVEEIVGRIRQAISETGETGFHFVDEAMPPALLGRLADQLIREGLAITWWGNVRFDAALAPMANRLAAAGCVALSGGLEVASERVLELINKGVTLDQVAQVTSALSAAGIHVHGYLMYGFPSQTLAETVDALEFVRQLYAEGALHSGVWHRFTLTAGSPIAQAPERFGIQLRPRTARTFSNYVLDYIDPTGPVPGFVRKALIQANAAYMLGVGLDTAVDRWFDGPVPPPGLPPRFVRDCLPD